MDILEFNEKCQKSMRITKNEPNSSDSDSDAGAKGTPEEVDQSKIDYQLARALDLIQGVAIFTFKEKSTP